MKRPCPVCGIRPVVYLGANHCSYHCWAASLRIARDPIAQQMLGLTEPEPPEVLEPEPSPEPGTPEPEKRTARQLDLLVTSSKR